MHRQKQWKLIVRVAAALAVAAVSLPASATPLNLLFFGNSFSIDNNVPGMVANLASDEGFDRPIVVTDLQGGFSVDDHRREVQNNPQNNIASPLLPAGQTFDYIIIQGLSTESTSVLGSHAEFAGDVVDWYNALRDHPSGRAADSRIVLFQTWARAPGHPIYPDTFANARTMQDDINAGYRAAWGALAGDSMGAEAAIAGVGEAFADRNFSRDLYIGELYHASYNGSRLAAETIFKSVYHRQWLSPDTGFRPGTSGGPDSPGTFPGGPLGGPAGGPQPSPGIPEPAAMSLLLIPMMLLRRKRS